MPQATLTFNDPVNSSLQVGDTIHYTPTTTVANSNIPISNSLINFGIVSSISPDFLTVIVMYSASPLPSITDYIMFEKNKQVNTSGLKGYYANVQFVNNSKTEAKLFSIASEVSESSK